MLPTDMPTGSMWEAQPAIPIPFAIGETVWVANSEPSYKTVACSECVGQKFVTIIKGNGEKLTLDCPVCEDFNYSSRGVIQETVYDFKPRQFVCRCITDIDMHSGEAHYTESNEDATTYSTASSNRLFRDYGECLAHCKILEAEYKADEERRVLANISSKRKHLTFSATYWSREVKKLERGLEAARARLNVSKELGKQKKSPVAEHA